MPIDILQAIEVSGADNKKFLQTQITADISELDKPNTPFILSAYCNQKGRVISVFYIIKNNNNYILIFLGDTSSIFLKKIKKYSIFSKIEFSEILNLNNYKDILNKANLNLEINYLINNKIPILLNNLSEKYLPDNLNLITLAAVSFKKGCFLGQEIIARVFYKGKNKKQLVHIKSDINIDNHIEIKTGPNTDATIVGEVIFCHENNGLAVIDVNYIDDSLLLDNTKITIIS